MKRFFATTCMLATAVLLLAQEPVVVEPKSKRSEKTTTTTSTATTTPTTTSSRYYSSYDDRAKRWAVGFNIGLGTKHPVLAFGLGANLQYFATDHFRIEASYNGFLRRKEWASWDVNVNFHYLFEVVERLEVYPLLGVAYTQARFKTTEEYVNYSETLRAPGFNVGAGAQYNITDHLFAKAECYWRYVPTKQLNATNAIVNNGELSYRAVIAVGLGVRF